MYEYRCDERLKTKNEESTLLSHTGLVTTESPKGENIFFILVFSPFFSFSLLQGSKQEKR